MISKDEKGKREKQLQSVRKTWYELQHIPSWIEGDYEWYTEINGTKHYVVYVDSISKYITLCNGKTQKEKDFTPRSKYWKEIVEDLSLTTPSRIL